MKLNNRIFDIQKGTMMKERGEEVSAMRNLRTGELVHEKESINDALLDYNEDLLQRGKHYNE